MSATLLALAVQVPVSAPSADSDHLQAPPATAGSAELIEAHQTGPVVDALDDLTADFRTVERLNPTPAAAERSRSTLASWRISPPYTTRGPPIG